MKDWNTSFFPRDCNRVRITRRDRFIDKFVSARRWAQSSVVEIIYTAILILVVISICIMIWSVR
jgi:hypothetical protein